MPLPQNTALRTQQEEKVQRVLEQLQWDTQVLRYTIDAPLLQSVSDYRSH